MTIKASNAAGETRGVAMLDRFKRLFTVSDRSGRVQQQLDQLRDRLPVPVFWMFGKTQSGKTSVIKYLTGADRAEIGKGFQPCTRFSSLYQFPTPEAPLATFLDTRGLDEPGYDPAEDLARFNNEAHVVVVVVKVLDHAQENVLKHLTTLRQAQRRRPVVLVLTCLHEAYPQQQHPLPYPFDNDGQSATPEATPPVPEDLLRSVAEQRRRFEKVVDRVALVDLTPSEEGFNDPEYGGPRLRQELLEVLPAAVGQTLRTLDEATHELQDMYARESLPHILGYSTLAASAGAVPVPVLDLVLLSGIQSRMIYHLAKLYGQPMDAKRFLEIGGGMGLGALTRQATRMTVVELLKLIPFVGSVMGAVAGAAVAWASTYALGKAFCYYYRRVHQGHVPQTEDLKRYYKEQLAQAEQLWKGTFGPNAKPAAESPPTGA
jgi:uncharacterized protein (DUF697 family)